MIDHVLTAHGSLSTITVLSSAFGGFPCGSAGKEYSRSAGHLGLIPGLGRSAGEGKGLSPLFSGLENSRDYTGPQRVRQD